MKKSEQDPKAAEVRPISKATMDAPQEEFIADQAGVVADAQAEVSPSKQALSAKTKTAESPHS